MRKFDQFLQLFKNGGQPITTLNMHSMYIPHGICNVPMFRNSKKLVRSRDGVQVGTQSIVKVRVWFPDLLQHLDIQA